jgi:hypothetical protein
VSAIIDEGCSARRREDACAISKNAWRFSWRLWKKELVMLREEVCDQHVMGITISWLIW